MGEFLKDNFLLANSESSSTSSSSPAEGVRAEVLNDDSSIPSELMEHLKSSHKTSKELEIKADSVYDQFLNKYLENSSNKAKAGIRGANALIIRNDALWEANKKNLPTKDQIISKVEYESLIRSANDRVIFKRFYQIKQLDILHEDKKNSFQDNRRSMLGLEISYNIWVKEFKETHQRELDLMKTDTVLRLKIFDALKKK